MKNLFKNLMLVAVAAMGFTACEQVIDDVNATNETFTVNIVGEFADDTRSGFDGKNGAGTGYKSAWDGKETVRFALIPETFTDETKVTVKDEENKIAGNSATFAPTFDSNEGTIHAFSPKGKFVSGVVSACEGGFTSSTLEPKYKNAYVVVPADQTPLANSVDRAAHILAGKADFAENVNMTFNHVVAYGKMTIKNFAGKIDKVEITASEPLAGISCKYFYNEGKLDNADVKTITLHPTYVVDNVFWFGCAPADLSNGTLTVKVYSGEDTYTKELAITGKTDENGEEIKFQFQQGRVASFSVNMEGKEADVKEEVVDPTALTYTLVKDVNNLKVGDKVVIVAAGFDVAMSTTQNGNNRAKAAVTKDGNIVTFKNDVQILTLEAGKTSGTFAFNTGSGYLYAASSSKNYLRTETTLSANSSWTIEITSAGVATIKAQGTNTNNWMRYNNTNNPPIFSCYGSGQSDICIYKGVEAGTDEPDQPSEPQPTALATPEITASVQNNNNIVVTWSEVADAASYVVTCTDQTDVTVNADATLSATFEGLDYDTQYTVTVKALPATDDTMHLESEVATKKVTTDSDPNAAPLIADGEYVIIASNGANNVFHALSSEANGKRLNAVEVNFDRTADVFETPNTSIIWTIKSTNGGYTISNGGKYLHWDSGNYANTDGTAESVVKIKESEEEGRYNIVWGGDDTRLLSKNDSADYFAFYTGTQRDDLYIVPAEQVEVVAQKLTMSALTTSETSNSITVSWTAVANASSYAVKIDNGAEQLVNGTSHTFTNLTAETSYNISVVAKGDGVYYLDSDPATATAKTLAAEEPEQPGEGGSDLVESLVTFDFTNISGFSSWGNSYAKHTVEYDDATVVFEAASHQTGTITNMPVTKGKTVEIKAKNNATMKAVKFTCKQWTTKTQTITLHYSTNGGSSYTSTGKTSTTFSIEHTELPAGTNAVKITFSSGSNQVGIQQADVTFLK